MRVIAAVKDVKNYLIPGGIYFNKGYSLTLQVYIYFKT